MKRIFVACMLVLGMFLPISLHAQQLPDSGFEDWSGEKFDGSIQLKYWNASNVSQVGFKFNFVTREAGHSGSYSARIIEREVGAMGITETSPAYLSLGQPWTYLESITKISQATAGCAGGIKFTYRPDSVEVWLKRTGADWAKEDYHVLYYSWKGTAQSDKYKGKNGNCTSVTKTNEESDVRLVMNHNECGTTQKAVQVCEGWHRTRGQMNNWTRIVIPVYYMSDEKPDMCNVIFSASNYPNYRANSGLYAGNDLYIDDIKMIYSSEIQALFIGGKQWKGFDPTSSDEQVYSVGKGVSTIPEIRAVRGIGTLTNPRGETGNFTGRTLSGSEITITNGKIDGAATVITVKAEDGSSTHTYKIKFVSAPSDNAKLADIMVNGSSMTNFSPNNRNFTVSLPYGTTAAPVVEAIKAEDGQTVKITQAGSTSGTCTIQVTAADGKTTGTYTINFTVALLADNTLVGIKVNGEEIAGFNPQQNIYTVELPLGTTEMPKVEAVSAYPKNEQTIVYTAPQKIDGGQYQISVSVPGNAITKTYKLNFKITASSNCSLKDLKVIGYEDKFLFEAFRLAYYISLPLGTTELPEIVWVAGDSYQTIERTDEGVDGITRIVVTAANGDSKTYKISFSTEKSSRTDLKAVYVDGKPLADFNPNQLTYKINLATGVTEIPEVTCDKGDEYQTVLIRQTGNTVRLQVTAGDGSTAIYQLDFVFKQADNASLQMIYIDGKELTGFAVDKYEYTYNLPSSYTSQPNVTWLQGDEYQTVSKRQKGGVTGDCILTVRSQAGTTNTYTIHFTQSVSTETTLKMIYIDGVEIEGFSAEKLEYTVSLPAGQATMPKVTYQKADESEQVIELTENQKVTLIVSAQNGDSRTYIVRFTLPMSDNALLQMIYLDGKVLDGFDQNILAYTCEIQNGKVPVITVLKSAGQQVTIQNSTGVGTAYITVTPEQGEGNIYTITFTEAMPQDVRLTSIKVDGTEIEGFSPETNEYTISYEGDRPEVSYTAVDGQTVSVLWEADRVRLLVENEGKVAYYTINLKRQQSATVTLKEILLDGTLIEGYKPEKTEYKIVVPAGQVIPTISYTKQDDTQVVFGGQTAKNEVSLVVVAESGDKGTYTLTFDVQPYTSTDLVAVYLDGEAVELQKGKYDYSFELEEQHPMPTLTYTADKGQTVMSYNASDIEQVIIVTAENGSQATYHFNYNVKYLTDADLKGLYIDGKELPDFASDKLEYTYTLPWRTRAVPSVQPVLNSETQTVVVTYNGVNEKTYIKVVASDGVTEKVYSVQFDVIKSKNTQLDYIVLSDVDFDFDPAKTDYTITLPYGINKAPQLFYKKQEEEQQVSLHLAPVTEPTTITVTAENGDTRTYTFHFKVQPAVGKNVLKSLTVRETEYSIPLNDSQMEYEVRLPFGTTSFTLDYEKSFAEQTVWMRQGGLLEPTVITVRGNRDTDDDKKYTIIPVVADNPAVLKSITINDELLADFDPQRFSYIVNTEYKGSNPIVTWTQEEEVDGNRVNVNVQIINSKHWRALVTCGEFSNYYDLWFYYPADVVPNGEFKDWTTAANNDAQKPVSWQVLADYFDKFTVVLSTHTFGQEVTKSGTDAVLLSTKISGGVSAYGGALGGYVPGFITLGSITGNLAVAGASTFTVQGGIDFHNSPDELIVRTRASSVSNSNRIVYQLWGAMGNAEKVLSTSTESAYTTHTIDLTEVNQKVGAPTQMNIILNSAFQESAYQTTSGSSAEMYVDYVRIAYNSKLAGIKVDGSEATKDGTSFTYTLPTAEYYGTPELTFTGEVEDQARQIVWSEEKNGVRTAEIRNFAEDGSYTDYTLTLTRPLSDNNLLTSIELDGEMLQGFNPETKEYAYNMPYGTTRMPDVNVGLATNRQTVFFIEGKSTIEITVKAENGSESVYRIQITRKSSSDTSLRNLACEGLEFEPETRQYTLTGKYMPELSILKQSDGQTVELDNEGKITVTAEDGTVGTYTISLTEPEQTTSGLLSQITLDGEDLEGFSPNTYTYQHKYARLLGFARQYATDKVLETIRFTGVVLEVEGTEKHTYTVSYPSNQSDNALLENIILDGKDYADFFAGLTSYTLPFSAPVDLRLIGEQGQRISVVPTSDSYSVEVTAPNGEVSQTYSIVLDPVESADATMLSVNVPDAYFYADKTELTIPVEVGNPKTQQPQIPDVWFYPTHGSSKVELEVSRNLGEASYFSIESEDATATRQYDLTFVADLSHNTDLSGIYVNGILVDKFDPQRHFYSAMVNAEAVLDYSTNDMFQTITVMNIDGDYQIHVVAEDGKTEADYYVTVFKKPLSDNATLKNILLNNLSFTQFSEDAVPFNPMNNQYVIPIGSSVELPDVSFELGAEGQTVTVEHRNGNIFVNVTAPDGKTTNTYTLAFNQNISDNTYLRNIYVGSETISGFDRTQTTYEVLLASGASMPTVTPVKDEDGQQLSQTVEGSNVVIVVTSESGNKQRTYIVSFVVSMSSNASLSTILLNNNELDEFVANTYFYSIQLSVGETFRAVEPVEGDEWQTIKVDTLVNTPSEQTLQIAVTAQDGSEQAYIVQQLLTLSSENRLDMIYIDGKPITDFTSDTYNYIVAEQGDITYDILSSSEQVEVVETAFGYQLVVTAEDGSRATYTITYQKPLSDNALLKGLKYGDTEIENFDEEKFDYRVSLLSGSETLPIVTYIKSEDAQNVTVMVEGQVVSLTVLAEDGTTTNTYTITFIIGESTNVYLKDILQDNEPIEGFEKEQSDYTITLPYGTSSLPEITAMKSDENQVVTISKPNDMTYVIEVVAPDGQTTGEYTIVFVVEKCPINTLEGITIDNQAIEDFSKDVLEYTFYYPNGTSEDELPDAEDVVYQLTDPTETVIVTKDNNTIYIEVTAENGDVRTYSITLQVELPNNALLDNLTVNGATIAGFDPQKFEYEYSLMQGEVEPLLEASAQDSTAEISITYRHIEEGSTGDTTFIYCTALDGTTEVYRVYLHYTAIDYLGDASGKIVLFKHIAGTDQYMAYSLRYGVSVMLFTTDGKRVVDVAVPPCNPNEALWDYDKDGAELLYDVTPNANGTVVDIPHRGEPYIYLIRQNNKRLESGKIMLVP